MEYRELELDKIREPTEDVLEEGEFIGGNHPDSAKSFVSDILYKLNNGATSHGCMDYRLKSRHLYVGSVRQWVTCDMNIGVALEGGGLATTELVRGLLGDLQYTYIEGISHW